MLLRMSNPAPTPLLSHRLAAYTRSVIAIRNLRKRDLAPALGISENQAYSRISGRTPFELDELDALADFLGCDVADLLRQDVA